MVVGAFPAAKLGVLALKQISKPIANVIKNRAKQNEFFRKYICMPPAQFYNWVEVKTKMWAMNLGKPVNVPKLNEAMATELGANLLGEFVIFTVGAAVLIYEYVRQMNKEYLKEQNTKEEKQQLLSTISELSFRVEKQEAQLREMSRIVYDLDSRSWFKLKSVHPLENNDTEQSQEKKFVGKYNPDCGLLFKALNIIENEIF